MSVCRRVGAGQAFGVRASIRARRSKKMSKPPWSARRGSIPLRLFTLKECGGCTERDRALRGCAARAAGCRAGYVYIASSTLERVTPITSPTVQGLPGGAEMNCVRYTGLTTPPSKARASGTLSRPPEEHAFTPPSKARASGTLSRPPEEHASTPPSKVRASGTLSRPPEEPLPSTHCKRGSLEAPV